MSSIFSDMRKNNSNFRLRNMNDLDTQLRGDLVAGLAHVGSLHQVVSGEDTTRRGNNINMVRRGNNINI